MKCIIKETLKLGFGISKLTQEQVNKVVKKIMKQRGITEKDAKKLAKVMIKKSMLTQEKVRGMVMDAAGNLFHAAGLATKKDISDLKKEMKSKKGKNK